MPFVGLMIGLYDNGNVLVIIAFKRRLSWLSWPR